MWVSWWCFLMSSNLVLQRLQTFPDLTPDTGWLYLWIRSLANWLKVFRHWKHRYEEEATLFVEVSWHNLLCLSSFLFEVDWILHISHLQENSIEYRNNNIKVIQYCLSYRSTCSIFRFSSQCPAFWDRWWSSFSMFWSLDVSRGLVLTKLLDVE